MKTFNNRKLFISILTIISLGFVFGDFIYQLDYGVDNLINSIRTTSGLSFFSYVTLLGDKYFLIFLSVLLSYLIYTFWTKDTFLLKVYWMALGLNVGTGLLIKYLVGRDRPLGAEVYEGYTYSFPSGHSLTALFVYGFIVIFILKLKRLETKKRYMTALIPLFLIFIVGFSRLYLGVHYASDILGGFLVGWFWLNFLISFLGDIPVEEVSSSVKVNI